MSLQDRLSGAEAAVRVVLKEVNNFSAESKTVISQDQKLISHCLSSTFRSIQAVHKDLITEGEDSEESRPIPGGFPSDDTESERSTVLLSQRFSALDEASSDALEHVCEFYRTAQDIDARLANIERDLKSISTDGKQKLKLAYASINAKKGEQTQATSTLLQCQQERSTLGDKIEHNKDKRDGLRVGRVLAWGSSLVYPPAAIVAAGMEIGAHKIRKKARDLEQRLQNQEASCAALRSEIAALGDAIGSIQREASATTKLSKQCSKVSAELKNHLSNLSDLMKDIFDIKVASDSFYSSTRSWKDQAELIADIQDDSDCVKRFTHRLLEDIDRTQQANLHERLLTWDGRSSMTIQDLLASSRDVRTSKTAVQVNIVEVS